MKRKDLGLHLKLFKNLNVSLVFISYISTYDSVYTHFIYRYLLPKQSNFC